MTRLKGQRFTLEYDTLGRVVLDRNRNKLSYSAGDLVSTFIKRFFSIVAEVAV
jgi:hypothetical protein